MMQRRRLAALSECMESRLVLSPVLSPATRSPVVHTDTSDAADVSNILVAEHVAAESGSAARLATARPNVIPALSNVAVRDVIVRDVIVREAAVRNAAGLDAIVSEAGVRNVVVPNMAVRDPEVPDEAVRNVDVTSRIEPVDAREPAVADRTVPAGSTVPLRAPDSIGSNDSLRTTSADDSNGEPPHGPRTTDRTEDNGTTTNVPDASTNATNTEPATENEPVARGIESLDGAVSVTPQVERVTEAVTTVENRDIVAVRASNDRGIDDEPQPPAAPLVRVDNLDPVSEAEPKVDTVVRPVRPAMEVDRTASVSVPEIVNDVRSADEIEIRSPIRIVEPSVEPVVQANADIEVMDVRVDELRSSIATELIDANVRVPSTDMVVPVVNSTVRADAERTATADSPVIIVVERPAATRVIAEAATPVAAVVRTDVRVVPVIQTDLSDLSSETRDESDAQTTVRAEADEVASVEIPVEIAETTHLPDQSNEASDTQPDENNDAAEAITITFSKPQNSTGGGRPKSPEPFRIVPTVADDDSVTASRESGPATDLTVPQRQRARAVHDSEPPTLDQGLLRREAVLFAAVNEVERVAFETVFGDATRLGMMLAAINHVGRRSGSLMTLSSFDDEARSEASYSANDRRSRTANGRRPSWIAERLRHAFSPFETVDEHQAIPGANGSEDLLFADAASMCVLFQESDECDSNIVRNSMCGGLMLGTAGLAANKFGKRRTHPPNTRPQPATPRYSGDTVVFAD